MLRLCKWLLTIAAAALLPAMYLVPTLAAHRGLFFWMLYALLVLVTLFLWGIGGTGNRHVADGFTPEENEKLRETQEILRRHSLWKW